ncbi:F0F1 ATP synthase subunit epsilon [Helicobacter cinaedi]|uniref:ATP synthase epsilon chain n=1 Tax=Helicobacter cinaedi TaxID=213 RepID=A0A377JVS8_9HELI|nr:ATP synthase F1 subunit epsilon [Helicobacter cinaedi]STP11302.1 F0F1 ATP synthase subunit epsilon [Helicobacter cinaedi]
MEHLTLSIVTPYGSIYNGEVKYVIMPGSEGEFGVYPGHCNILSLLKVGVIEFENTQGNRELVAINWGYAEVSSTDVKIIADGAVAIGGSAESKIASALDNARTLLTEATTDNALIGAVVSRIENAAKSRI